jgi:hypothetical protein
MTVTDTAASFIRALYLPPAAKWNTLSAFRIVSEEALV